MIFLKKIWGYIKPISAWLAALLLPFLYQLGKAIFNGIVGNRSDDFFVKFYASLGTIDLSQLILISSVLIFIYIVILYVRLQYRYKDLKSVSDKIINLDDITFTTIPNLYQKNPEETLKKFLTLLLSEFAKIFSDKIFRAAILKPNSEKEFLKFWIGYRMPIENMSNDGFYIGNDTSRKTGVAGRCYKTGEIRIVKFYKKDNKYQTDDIEYITSQNSTRPGYDAFVTIPIFEADKKTGNRTCIGVLCLDSPQVDLFDDKKVIEFLQTFSNRISFVLFIHRKFLENHD